MNKKYEVAVNLQQDFTAAEQAQGRNNIEACNNANIAPVYTNKTYEANSYVMHDGILYTNENAITTAENWTPAHWTQTTVAEMIAGVGILSVIIERSTEETDADFKITNGVTRAQLDNAVNEGTLIIATIKRGANTYITTLFTLTGTPRYFVLWLQTWQTNPSLRAIVIDPDSNCHWVSNNFTTPSGWEPPYTAE